MGPGMKDSSLLLPRGAQKKESQTYETRQRMVTGTSLPNIKGIKKPFPQLTPSSSRLSKNISSATEKTSHSNLDDVQSRSFYKKGNRMNESSQKNSSMNVGPPPNRAKGSKKKDPLEKKPSKSQLPLIPSQLKSSIIDISQRTEDELKGGSHMEGDPKRNISASVAEATSFGSRFPEPSMGKLLLDFQSLSITEEDTDEDSASDLSDSERIPFPPSPFTPPELNLRAEEIDPVCFDPHVDQGSEQAEYYYPDFLPPPFNSWDLNNMASSTSTEYKSELLPQTIESLGKYIDRLVQLEWLQMQTVQNEKIKLVKARPQTAPGTLWSAKSPVKSRLFPNTLSSRILTHPEGFTKFSPGQAVHLRKREVHCEEAHPSYYVFQSSPKTIDAISSRSCPQKQNYEMRMKEKKKKPNEGAKQQLLELPCNDSSSKIQASGNIRIPKQPQMVLSSVEHLKPLKAPIRPNPKRNGNANNYGPANKATAGRELKTNGGKQASYVFK
ncbi:protein FAM217B isoform X1 [Sarcophilus harrisii]|uniref:Family with sequence similarity 217 member B n=2 Tax=Sarcophilus harrisii TaxID=9305 RepID=A0A7N4P235_SARHA|nr:protein FAM217B isoform X1 [Sarcophilus harrisii]